MIFGMVARRSTRSRRRCVVSVSAERAALPWRARRVLRQTWTTLGAAALLWLAGLALLVRLPARRHPAAPRRDRNGPAGDRRTALAQPSRSARAAAGGSRRRLRTCASRFSRMTASRELPALLARAASVLDASGLIIWVGGGEELFAARRARLRPARHRPARTDWQERRQRHGRLVAQRRGEGSFPAT